MNMKYLIGLSFLLSSVVYAGSEGNVGNGGLVVVCPGKKIELLDYFEGKIINPNYKQDLGKSSLNYSQKMEYVLSRFAQYDPTRAEAYSEQGNKLTNPENSSFLKNISIRYTEDAIISNDKVKKALQDCELRTVVMQKSKRLPGEKPFLIDQDMWNALDSENKAGLVLHEVIYHEALALGQKTSDSARDLNFLISTTELAPYNIKVLTEYYKHMIVLGFISTPIKTLEATMRRSDVIYCPSEQKAQFLDFFEWGAKANAKLEMGDVSLSPFKIVDHVLFKKLSRLDPKRARHYKRLINYIWSHIKFSNHSLGTIEGGENLDFTLNGCHLERILVRVPFDHNDNIYFINSNIWNLLTNAEKAGVLLHAAVVESLSDFKELLVNQSNVRYFTYLASSSLLENLKSEDYSTLTASLGVQLDWSNDYQQIGKLLYFELEDGKTLLIKNAFCTNYNGASYPGDSPQCRRIKSEGLSSIQIWEGFLTNNAHILISNTAVPLSIDHPVKFYPGQTFFAGVVDSDSVIHLNNGQKIELLIGEAISFSESINKSHIELKLFFGLQAAYPIYDESSGRRRNPNLAAQYDSKFEIPQTRKRKISVYGQELEIAEANICIRNNSIQNVSSNIKIQIKGKKYKLSDVYFNDKGDVDYILSECPSCAKIHL